MITISDNTSEKRISVSLIVLIICQYLIPPEGAFLVNVFLIMVNILRTRHIYKKYFPGLNFLLILAVYLLLITGFSLLFVPSNYKDIFRDIFYLFNGITALIFGSCLSKTGLSYYRFLNSFIISSMILVVKFWIEFFIKISSNIYQLTSGNIEVWRETVGHGSPFTTLCLVIIFSQIIPKEKRLSKAIQAMFVFLALTQLVITFSRTSIILLIVLLLVFNYEQLFRFSLKKIILFILLIGLFAFLFHIFGDNLLFQNFLTKLTNSFNEISSKNDYSTIASIQRNWRGYEVFSAIKEWSKGSLFNQIFGFGLGKKIFVGQVSTLVDPNSNGWISVLHNGYYTILLKGGVIALLLYISYYVYSFVIGFKNYLETKNKFSLYFCGAIGALAISTIFLNGLFRDSINLSLIYFVGFFGNIILVPRKYDEE